MVQNTKESSPKYGATRSSVCSFAALTHLLATYCLLCSRTPLHSFISSHCSLIHLLCTACFARVLPCAHLLSCSLIHTQASGTMNHKMLGHLAVLDHSAREGRNNGRDKRYKGSQRPTMASLPQRLRAAVGFAHNLPRM